MNDTTTGHTIEEYLYLLLSLLFGIFIYYVNSISPLIPGDDYIFSMKIPEEGIVNGERINSLGDLIESQKNFYNTYHYRVLNHSILQILLLFPKGLFNILNTIVFLLLPIVVLTIVKEDRLEYIKKYFFLLLVIWCLHFNLGWCYYQVTGALNYTWYLIPQLLYVSFLIKYMLGDELHVSVIPLAIINSLGNENVTASLFVLTFVVLFFTRHKKNYRLIISIVVLLCGGMFMLDSPAIAWRMEHQGFREGGLSGHLIEYLRRVAYYSIFYVSLIGMAIYNTRKQLYINRKVLLLLFVFLCATGIMLGIPLFEPRSAIFGFFICMMIMVVLMENKLLRSSLILFLIFLSAILMYVRVPIMLQHQQRHQANVQLMENNRNTKDKVFLNKFCDPTNQTVVLCKELIKNDALLDYSSVSAYYNIENLIPYAGYNWDKVQAQLSNATEAQVFLETYERKEISKNKVLYYKIVEQGMEILMVYPNSESMLHIIRGSLKGINKHRIFDFLPLNIRIYFLSYLEDLTVREDRRISIGQDRECSLLYVDNIDQYKYLILSEYSLKLHAPVGLKTKLELVY